MKSTPTLSLSQIWNMSLGFLGIQFGFALQNANASRILQTYGADVEHLSWFWLAAPITGMLVQPLVGYFSDKTWNRLGRRKPYFLVGGILTAIALFLMPNSGLFAHLIPPIMVGAGMLMIMDASINVAMEPFRALVADLLPPQQRTLGFSVQTFLIGIGAVVASWFPYILGEWFDVPTTSSAGKVPDNVIYSFYIGGVVLVATIIWTITHTQEHPPTEEDRLKNKYTTISSIITDIKEMPRTMRRLGLVQFFSWFALFSMWVYTTPAVAEHFYHTTDASSAAYQQAGDWVGILFGIYNGVAMFVALLLPPLAKRWGRKPTYSISLLCGAIGLLSFFVIKDPRFLLISMIGVGIAWASILAMPYAILAGALPPAKMGVYMGIFNFFITIPQIVSGICNRYLVAYLYDRNTLWALLTAGIFLLLAACAVWWVHDSTDK